MGFAYKTKASEAKKADAAQGAPVGGSFGFRFIFFFVLL